MLAKQYRLSRNVDIKRVITRGKTRIYKDLFLLKWILNNKSNNRVVIIVSQKVSKKAVERNRIRRVLINALKKDDMQGKRSYDIAVIVRKGALYSEDKAREQFLEFLNTIKT